MAIPGWARIELPFHTGELAIQARMFELGELDPVAPQPIHEITA